MIFLCIFAAGIWCSVPWRRLPKFRYINNNNKPSNEKKSLHQLKQAQVCPRQQSHAVMVRNKRIR